MNMFETLYGPKTVGAAASHDTFTAINACSECHGVLFYARCTVDYLRGNDLLMSTC